MLTDGNVHIFEVNPVRAISSQCEGGHSRGNMRGETRGVSNDPLNQWPHLLTGAQESGRGMQSSTPQVEATSAAG